MAQSSTGLTRDQLRSLRDAFPGDIVTPADEAYDDARRLWNAVHDRRPAVIVRPRTSSEVATAIRFARDLDLPLAVRSGGHSPAGHATCDGGLVIDLSHNGGLLPRSGPGPEPGSTVVGCNIVVGVDDVDGLMRRGIELGGIEALPATDMPDVGRIGYLLDPDNNVFGLISAVMSDGTTGMGGGE